MKKSILFVSIFLFFSALFAAMAVYNSREGVATPFILFSLFFIYVFIKKQDDIFHPAIIITVIFWLNTFVALFMNEDWLEGYYLNYSYKTFLFYSLSLILVIYPSLWIKKYGVNTIADNFVTSYFIKYSWPFISFSLLYQLPYAASSLSSGAAAIRGSLATEGVLPPNGFTTLAVGISFFYPIFIMFWFLTVIYKYSKFFQFFMLIGAFLGIVSGMVFMARDRLLWVPLFFVLGYWYWGDMLTQRQKAKLKKIGILLLFAVIFVLSIFTIDRFAHTEYGSLGSLMLYYGNQPYVFAENVAERTSYYGMTYRFPVLEPIIGDGREIVRTVPYEWQFGTFLADFYSISGWNSLVISIVVIFVFFGSNFILKSKKYDGSRFFLMVLYFHFMVQGVFYFSFGNQGGNYYIMIMFAMAYIMKIGERKI